MRKMIIECDVCHEVIDGNPIALRMERVDRETTDFIGGDSVDDRTFELCDICVDRLIGLLTGEIRPEPAAPEPEEYPCGMAIDDADIHPYKNPKAPIVFATAEKQDCGIEAEEEDIEAVVVPEKVKKPRKRNMQIDHAKIKALHDAGWKPKDIAGRYGFGRQAGLQLNL